MLVALRLLLLILLSAFLGQSLAHAQSLPNEFTVEGRLYDSSGNPLQGPADITLQLLEPGSNHCVLYSEKHTGVVLYSNEASAVGVFALRLGTGTPIFPVSTPNLASLFSNSVTQTGQGGGACAALTFTPGTYRLVRVIVNTGSGDETLSPDTVLNTQPTAGLADTANTLQGYSAANFILTNNNSSLVQTNVETIFSLSNYTKLTQLLSGYPYMSATPSSNVNFSGVALTNVGAPIAAGDAANKQYTDSYLGGRAIASLSGLSTGQVLAWNASGSRWEARQFSGVTAVTAGTGLQATVTGSTVQLDVSVGTTASSILQLDSSAKIPAVDGSQLINVSASKLQGFNVSSSSPSAGQVLTWNGSGSRWESWTPTVADDSILSAKIHSSNIAVNRLLITDGTSGNSVTYMTCPTDGEFLQWSAATGWGCSTISGALGASGVVAGTQGSTTKVPVVTVDVQGRVTSLTNVNIAFPVTSVAGRTGAVSLTVSDVVGFGTAAVENVGTAANDLVQLDSVGALPSVDGSALSNLNANRLAGRDVEASVIPSDKTVLTWNASGSKWQALPAPTGNSGTVTRIQAGNGLVAGIITGTGTLDVDTGTSANQIVKLDGSASMPAVEAFALTNSNAFNLRGKPILLTTVNDSNVLFYNASGAFWRAGGFSGDIGVTNGGSVTVSSIQGNAVKAGTPSHGQVLTWNNSGQWEFQVSSGGSVTQVIAGSGLKTAAITSVGTLEVDTGTTANKIVALDSNGWLPAVDGFKVMNANAVNIQGWSVSNSVPTNTQFLAFNSSGSSWTPTSIGGDISVADGGVVTVTKIRNFPIQTGAPTLSGQVLTWNASGTQWDFQSPAGVAFPLLATSSGTAANPTYSFSGDTNTGIFSLSADNLNFATNGFQRLVIDQLGNVGIGVSNPTQALDVAGKVKATYFVGDGSALTGINSTMIGSYPISSQAPSPNQVLTWNGSSWIPTNAATGTVIGISVGVGLSPTGTITTTGTLNVDVGTTPGKIVQLDPNGAYPAVEGFNISNSNALNIRGKPISAVAAADANFLIYNGSGNIWAPISLASDAVLAANGNLTVTKIRNMAIKSGTPSGNGMVLTWNTSGTQWDFQNPAGGSFPLLATSGGNATSPVYSFSGDTNTGIYSTGADNLNFTTNGSQRMSIDQLGNISIGPLWVGSPGRVGIGTIAPTSNLTIYGSSAYVETAILSSGGNLTLGVSTTTNGLSESEPANTAYLSNASNTPLMFGTANMVRMTIDQLGNVGIGTTTPTKTLSFNGQAPTTIGTERNKTAGAPGSSLTLLAGASAVGSVDKNGGTLVLSSGSSTGAGNSSIYLQTATGGGSGSANRTPSTQLSIVGPSVGIGIGSTSAIGALQLGGAQTFDGMAAPVLSQSGKGTIYFDSTNNQFYVSQNGGTYQPLVGTGSTSFMVFNSNSDGSGGDGGFNFLVNGSNVLSIDNLGNVNISGNETLAAGKNLTLSSGTGRFSQTYSGAGPAASISGTSSSSGNLLNLTTTSTSAVSGDRALNISVSGANGSGSITRYGVYSSVTSTGATSTNVAGYFTASGGSNNFALVVPANGGSVGFGTANPTVNFEVSSDITDPSAASFVGTKMHANPTYTTGNANDFYGSRFTTAPSISSGTTTGNIWSLHSESVVNTSSPGTINNMSAIRADYGIRSTGSGSVVNSYGLYLVPYSQMGTITSSYGVYIASPQTGSGTITNEYGIYQTSATAANFFSGRVGIGVVAPNEPLNVTTASTSGNVFAVNTPTGFSGNYVQINQNGTAKFTVDSQGRTYASTGSSSTPGYSFQNYSGTGMFAPAGNSLGLATNGQPAIIIDSSQNVGIGTGTPLSKLDINGQVNASKYLLGNNTVLAEPNGTTNISVGYQALNLLTTGTANTAVGQNALRAVTTNSQNTAVGNSALYQNTGSNNTAIGYSSISGTGTGSYNIAIGFNAGSNINNGSGNILIGGSAAGTVDLPSAGSSYNLNIGNVIFANNMTGSTATPAGNVGIGTNSPTIGAVLDVNGTGPNGSSMIVPRDSSANRPTSPVDGMIRYNTTASALETRVNGGWQFVGSNRSIINLFEDFMNVGNLPGGNAVSVGSALWSSGVMTGKGLTSASTNAPGILTVTPQTTSSTATAISFCTHTSTFGAPAPSMIHSSTTPWSFEARINNPGSSTTQQVVRIGLVDSNIYGSAPIGFYFEIPGGGTSYNFVTSGGASGNTAYSQGVGVYDRLTISYDGTNVSFFVNGTFVATGGSVTSGTALCPGVFLANGTGVSARPLNIDYMSFTQVVNRP